MGTHDSQRLPRVCTFLTQLDSPGTGGTSYARLWNAATGEGEEKMSMEQIHKKVVEMEKEIAKLKRREVRAICVEVIMRVSNPPFVF